jgi:hypothetical protein
MGFPAQPRQRRLLCLPVLGLIVVSTLSPCAAEKDESFSQIWADFSDYRQVTPSLELGSDLGIRGFALDDEITQAFIRPSFNYRISETVTLHGGVRFFYTFFTSSKDVFEIGPWQGLRIRWPNLEKVQISHYFRAEERFFRRLRGGDSAFDIRIRYKLGAVIPLSNTAAVNGKIYIPLSFEVFGDPTPAIEGGVYTSYRVTGGIGYRFNAKWRLELHYLRQNFDIEGPDRFRAIGHFFRIRIRG